jgi:predicted nucleic acid-binding Zn ribbon protein
MKRHHYLNNFGLTEKERDATCPNPLCHNPSFVKHHGRQIYCSKACGTEHRRVKNYPVVEDVKPVNFHHLCNYCGTEYGAARSSAQFCSTSCRVMFNKQDRMAEWVNKRMTFNADDHLYDELDGEIFIECEFNNFDFSGKSLTKAKFINCVINNCCFDKTFFDGVELIDTDFEGYNTFRGALVRFTKFPLVSETVLDLSGIIESKVKRSVLLKVQREKLENKRISFYE